jgi:hypothetical protein
LAGFQVIPEGSRALIDDQTLAVSQLHRARFAGVWVVCGQESTPVAEARH